MDRNRICLLGGMMVRVTDWRTPLSLTADAVEMGAAACKKGQGWHQSMGIKAWASKHGHQSGHSIFDNLLHQQHGAHSSNNSTP